MRDIAVFALLAIAATDLLHDHDHEWSNPKWVGITQKAFCPDQIELDATCGSHEANQRCCKLYAECRIVAQRYNSVMTDEQLGCFVLASTIVPPLLMQQ